MKRFYLFLLLFCPLLVCGAALEVVLECPEMPILSGRKENPCLKVYLIKDQASALPIRSLNVQISGTKGIRDVQTLQVYQTSVKGQFNTKKALSSVHKVSEQMQIPIDLICTKDTTCMWISIQLKDKIDLLQKIKIRCESIVTEQETVLPITVIDKWLRVGVSLRKSGEEGVKDFRIPGLIKSSKGTLMAIYDARHDRIRDLQGNIDIGLSRSMDEGKSWKEMQIVLDQEKWGELPEKFNGVSDACILADINTKKIFIAGLWMHGLFDPKTGEWIKGLTEQSQEWNHQWKSHGSGPGYGEKETCQFLITESTNDGKKWSKPINITRIKPEKWWLLAPAPGNGITLKNGTLVFPAQGRDSVGKSFSTIVYSTDHGKSWQVGEPAFSGSTECAVVELEDGDLMLNMRSSKVNGRAIYTTSDVGKTWLRHSTSHGALIEPVCMASLYKHEYTLNGEKKSVLLFSNPNSSEARVKMTIKMSFDEGKTWPTDKWIEINELRSAGYSSLTSISDDVIGIFYEGSYATMTFQQVDISEYLR